MIPIALAAVLAGGGAARAAQPVHPRLIVVITVDQMRADYLDRWRAQLTGGLATLLDDGAVFTSAFQDHGATVTAPGHATILAGRWPAHTGILSDDIGVPDSASPLVGGAGPGASPWRFRGTSFFDWLHQAEPEARALSVSRKDRGAILPLGRARQSVFWYDAGAFVTSRYYADTLPEWVRAFNARRLPFRYAGTAWRPLLADTAYPEPDSEPYENAGHDVAFPHVLPADSGRAAVALVGDPRMDSLTLAFALDGAEAMRLGRGRSTDLLAVSLSTTDAVGHAFGPNSREVHDQILRLDRYLGWFLDRLFDRYGKGNVLIVLDADHGVTPYPEWSRAHGHPAARGVTIDTLVQAENAAIGRLLPGAPARPWLIFDTGMLFLRDDGRLAAAGVNVDSLVGAVAKRIRAVPGVARVDRPEDLAAADTATDAVARRWVHMIPDNAGVVLVVTLEDRDVWAEWPIAEHGQPSDRDAHIPLIFWGKGVAPGTYAERVNAVDIAPTLATLVGVTPLSLVDGRVLRDAIRP